LHRISCSHRDFDLDLTLESGQVFQWRRDADRWWVGLIEPDPCPIRIRQTDRYLELQLFGDIAVERIRDYFRLDDPLQDYVAQWTRDGGPEIIEAVDAFAGLRLIRQDPWECLISFMMSPAAPIHRIRSSLQRLSRALGDPCGSIGGLDLYRFPDPWRLAQTKRAVYDEAGFGFRGPHIAAASALICACGGADWVRSLRQVPYPKAKAELMTLPGVGDKVADCVCLFSLDNDEAVPIDVHIARVARALFDNVPRSLTPRNYALIADMYRQRYGPKAGWAQQYLFRDQIGGRVIYCDEQGKHRKSAR